MSDPSPEKTELRFYTDTHIARAVARQLRERGIDVVRCEEVGLASASDIEHLEYATREHRTIITNDDDFLLLDRLWRREGKRHAGIMYCLPHVQGIAAIGRIVNECADLHVLILNGAGSVEADIENQIIYVS